MSWVFIPSLLFAQGGPVVVECDLYFRNATGVLDFLTNLNKGARETLTFKETRATEAKGANCIRRGFQHGDGCALIVRDKSQHGLFTFESEDINVGSETLTTLLNTLKKQGNKVSFQRGDDLTIACDPSSEKEENRFCRFSQKIERRR